MTSGIEQQSFFPDDSDPVLERTLRGGNMAGLLSVAGRRVLDVIPDELADDPAVTLLRDVLGGDPPEDYDPRPYIAANEWTFASTMPENPHEYVLLRNSSDWREHLRFLRWIRRGKVEVWRDRRRYRYRVVDGWRYWALGPNDTILNRATER